MAPQVAVVLESVSRCFSLPSRESFFALRDVTLQIPRGELVAVVGKSGSGKSTLLHLLAGLDRPTRGSVTSAGTKLHDMDETAMAAWRGRNVGVVFQFFQLLPTLTVLENVLFAMELVDSVESGTRLTRARDLLALVGIAEQADKLPATLSGGQQQRAAIARALANDPALIVADEPTGNLDTATGAEVVAVLRGLRDQGKTLVVVTHDEELAAMADRVIRLRDGQVV